MHTPIFRKDNLHFLIVCLGHHKKLTTSHPAIDCPPDYVPPDRLDHPSNQAFRHTMLRKSRFPSMSVVRTLALSLTA